MALEGPYKGVCGGGLLAVNGESDGGEGMLPLGGIPFAVWGGRPAGTKGILACG